MARTSSRPCPALTCSILKGQPHGNPDCMCVCALMCVGERFYGMAADSVFRIPLWRHVYTWLGIVPASAANLKRYLKWGSVGITPGGIAEMYLAGMAHHSTTPTVGRHSVFVCRSVCVPNTIGRVGLHVVGWLGVRGMVSTAGGIVVVARQCALPPRSPGPSLYRRQLSCCSSNSWTLDASHTLICHIRIGPSCNSHL